MTVPVKEAGDHVLPETPEHSTYRTSAYPLTRINPTSAATPCADVVGHEASMGQPTPMTRDLERVPASSVGFSK